MRAESISVNFDHCVSSKGQIQPLVFLDAVAAVDRFAVRRNRLEPKPHARHLTETQKQPTQLGNRPVTHSPKHSKPL